MGVFVGVRAFVCVCMCVRSAKKVYCYYYNEFEIAVWRTFVENVIKVHLAKAFRDNGIFRRHWSWETIVWFVWDIALLFRKLLQH